MHGTGPEGNGYVGGGAIEALLEPGEEPCFLIDPVRATLEAANLAAQALFKLPSPQDLPMPLDSAMPAIRELRGLTAYANSQSKQLSFWIAGQMQKLACIVTVVVQDRSASGSSRNLVHVRCAKRIENLSERSDAKSELANSSPTRAMETPIDREAPIARSDAETLREIARRIREGRPARLSPDFEQPMAPAPPAGEALRSNRPVPPTSLGTEPNEPSPPDARTLARIAHELKTPLSAIVAASEIMRDERLGEMQNARYLEYARDIYESARHTLDVIDAMLKRGADEKSAFEPIALDKIAEATVSAMKPLAEASEIFLTARSENGRLEVLADPTAVRQIIYNLITNALKFTLPGGEVHVMTGYLDDGSVYLVVRDTGQGMDEDAIAQAFFADGSVLTPRSGGGYGLGLPTVRRLAEELGAALEVDSAPGKGTAILLSFPRHHGS